MKYLQINHLCILQNAKNLISKWCVCGVFTGQLYRTTIEENMWVIGLTFNFIFVICSSWIWLILYLLIEFHSQMQLLDPPSLTSQLILTNASLFLITQYSFVENVPVIIFWSELFNYRLRCIQYTFYQILYKITQIT